MENVTDAAVQNLVTQFSSALDFFRELVQNSIDAGTDRVDVWMEFLPGDRGGTIAIHVDDFGEGMNEEIIDKQLTRLFSSSKENDLTKIGKFGIGFVSVFALQPKAVLIHTGRDGEYWEVLFHEDRSFNKSKIETPCEGTQITLFVEGDRTRYRELVLGSRKTLGHWCGHSEIEVTFEDRSSSLETGGMEIINKPFEIGGECATEAAAEGTRVVLAYDSRPSWGFYNKGLALAVVEGQTDLVPDRLRHVAFKIKSRYLEHTLSRETVMRDKNYDKAMALVTSAADGPLFNGLVTRLRQHVERSVAWGLAEIEAYLELMGYLAAEPFDAVLARHEVPLLRTVDGHALSMAQVWDAAQEDGHIFVSDAATPLTQRLSAQGTPVLLGRGLTADRNELHRDSVVRLLHGYIERRLTEGIFGYFRGRFMPAEVRERAVGTVVAPEQVLLSIELVEDAEPEVKELLRQAHEVLKYAMPDTSHTVVRPLGEATVEPERIDLSYRALLACRVTSRTDHAPLFVVGRQVGPLMAIPPPGRISAERSARPEAAVDIGHPQFRGLLDLFAHEPRMAAYCLAKDLLLAEDRGLERDLELMHTAREMPL